MKTPSSQDKCDSKSCDHPPFSLSTKSPGGYDFGFGGAKIAELEKLHEVSHPGDVVFFGVDNELNRRLGAHNPGAATFVRGKTLSMMPWTQSCATACHDIGIMVAEGPENTLQAVRFMSRQLTAIGLRPVLIGCDHTASMASVKGVTDVIKSPLRYFYFDAHYDLGLHCKTPYLHNGNFVNFLLHADRINGVVNVGGRCWTNYLPVYRDVPGLVWIPGGVNHMTAGAIIEHLSWFRGASLYVSIDADVLDPSCAPNVSCPEPFGMSASELFSVCEWIGKSCAVIGADLCEIVPSNQSLESEMVLMRCLHALFPKVKTR